MKHRTTVYQEPATCQVLYCARAFTNTMSNPSDKLKRYYCPYLFDGQTMAQ